MAVAFTLPVTLILSVSTMVAVNWTEPAPDAGSPDIAGLEILPSELLGKGRRRSTKGFEMFFAPARAAESTPFASSALTRYHRPPSMPRATKPRSTRRARANMTTKAPRWLSMILLIIPLHLSRSGVRSARLENGPAPDQDAPVDGEQVLDEVRQRRDRPVVVKHLDDADLRNVGVLFAARYVR